MLSYGAKAAQHYGAIRAVLEKLGQPIGVNDLHIAGHARSEGLVLVTHNVSEFQRVPAMIRRLHKSLGIPANVLIAETAAG